jgi:hypothetical protein
VSSAALATLGVVPAMASTYHVDSSQALQSAVAQADAGSGASTIELAAGTYIPNSTLTIKHDVTIAGPSAAPGAELAGTGIEPFPSDLLRVEHHAELTLSNVLVTGGGGEGTTAAIDDYGSLELESSTLAGNPGAGLWVEPEGAATVVSSTLSYGLAFALVNDGRANLVNVTVADNKDGGIENTGTLDLINTIVADNKRADCRGRATVSDHSLDSDGSCGVGTLSGSDPRLARLAANGGPTNTQALEAGSPAIAAADPAKCPAEDQRHFVRDGACDIGAYQTTAVSGAGVAHSGESPTEPGSVSGAGALLAIRAQGSLRGRGGRRITFALRVEVGHSHATFSYREGGGGVTLDRLTVSSVAFDGPRGVVTVHGEAAATAGARRVRLTLVLTSYHGRRALRIKLSGGYYRSAPLASGSITFLRAAA